jgi:ABC-type Fe3+/spermidine/putrescine transport system ATPase subunit
MVTHDTEDALHVGDKVAVLQKGTIEQIGSPHEVYHHPTSGYSARIFGEANQVGQHWVRPEDMEFLAAYAPESHPVMIEEVHDAGRHLEIRVRPQDVSPSVKWVLYDSNQPGIKVGSPGWVRFKGKSA